MKSILLKSKNFSSVNLIKLQRIKDKFNHFHSLIQSKIDSQAHFNYELFKKINHFFEKNGFQDYYYFPKIKRLESNSKKIFIRAQDCLDNPLINEEEISGIVKEL